MDSTAVAKRPTKVGASAAGPRESGATLVIVAIILPLLLALGALALDVSHLYFTRKELQNAADACALAAARTLYADDGTAILLTANHTGFVAAKGNPSESAAVELWHGGAEFTGTTWPTDNEGDIQRGHWNFKPWTGLAARTFTPNASTALPNLSEVSTDQLDEDTDFINAARCVTRREATAVTNYLAPVLSLFGGNFLTSIVRAEAVAIRGYAGSLEPGEVDLPIGLCSEKLRNADGEYSCNTGRMLNDGNTEGTSETAMWTDFTQSSNCSAASASEVRPLICANGNPDELVFGHSLDSTNGTTTATLDDLIDCWKTGLHLDTSTPPDDVPDADLDTDGDGWPDVPWEVDLPVVNCGNNDPCTPLVGAVKVNIVAMVRSANLSGTNKYDEVLTKMAGTETYSDWTCSSLTGGACADSGAYPTAGDKRQCCWGEFVDHFHLKNSDGNPAPYASKSIYFVPDCSPHEPHGRTGGENFGFLSLYPALVR